jgi:predicted nucleic acid-binding protein
MKPLFADTFYYLALGNRRDVAHSRVVRFSETLHSPLVTTAWVLTEVADAMARATDRAAFLVLMKLIRANPDVTVVPPSEELFGRGLGLYAGRPDKDWSLTDCISFVAMTDYGITEALTGDHHFEQAGFRALLKE